MCVCVHPQDTARVRFVGTTAQHWQSDMALDDISVTAVTPPPSPAPTASGPAIDVGVAIRQVGNRVWMKRGDRG